MNRMFCFLFLSVGIACLSTVVAQDIKPLVSKLTAEQQRQVLAYMTELGVGLDEQVVAAFGALDAEGKRKMTQYLQAVQPRDGVKVRRTTVAWSRDTIHLGQIPEGESFMDSVVVTNTGTAPYSIIDVRTACDCIVWKIPNRAILPGEQATVSFEFKSKNKKGKVRTGIVLQDTSTPNARSILYITGEVVVPRSGGKRPWED